MVSNWEMTRQTAAFLYKPSREWRLIMFLKMPFPRNVLATEQNLL